MGVDMRRKAAVVFIAFLALESILSALIAAADSVTTPLEQSGLAPLWEENFSGGSIDRMVFTWAKGDNNGLDSYVQPGAVYLGKDGGDPHVEQEINNFKTYVGESLPSTIEFDVLSPYEARGRLSLRPRRRGDFAHLRLGYSANNTSILFAFTDAPSTLVEYAEDTTGDNGWAHVVASYRQFVSGTQIYAHYVVAINEEVHEFQGPSGITDPDWLTYWNSTQDADGWSIEHDSFEPVMGKYVANVRGYSQFLTLAQLQSQLQGRVAPYLAALPDPRDYTGPVKAFQVHKTLDTHGPNAMAYADQIGPLDVRFDGSLSSSWRPMTYRWSFGDGTTGTGRLVNHTYAQAGTYTVRLTVTNQYGSDVHQITVNVATVRSVSLSDGQMATALPGSTVTFTHRVTNTGNGLDSFNLAAAVDLPGWPASVSPGSIGPLAPGGSAPVKVAVQIPAGALGNVDGHVTATAQSQASSAASDTAVDTIDVQAVPGVSLSPARSFKVPAGSQQVYTRTVTNMGNVPDTFTVQVSFDAAGWGVSVSPSNAGPLQPSQTRALTVSVVVPPWAVVDSVEAIRVMAVSQANPAVRDTVDDRVTVLRGVIELDNFAFLPVLLKP